MINSAETLQNSGSFKLTTEGFAGVLATPVAVTDGALDVISPADTAEGFYT